MWFKNLYLFQFSKDVDYTPDSLHEALSEKPFVPCTAIQRESQGWTPPLGKNASAFTHASNNFILLSMARQERLLPGSVVRETLQERVDDIQEREGRKVGSKEKKELRETIEDELLPRSFTRNQTVDAWIDVKGGWLVINTASVKLAEAFTTLLRDTLGSLPVVLPKAEAVSPVLTDWLSRYSATAPFAIGEQCELKGKGDDVGVVSLKKHDLSTDEVKHHLQSGKQVSKLELSWDEKVSFVLGEDMIVRRLKFQDVMEEARHEEDPQSHEEHVDIEFTLMTGELSRMIPQLIKVFS